MIGNDPSAARQSSRHRVADRGEPLGPNATGLFGATIVGCCFERLETVDAELMVQMSGQAFPDARQRREQRDRVRLAPQPVQHGETARLDEGTNGAREDDPNRRQPLEAFDPLATQDLRHRPPQLAHRRGAAVIRFHPIGAGVLHVEQLRDLIEARRDLGVQGIDPRRLHTAVTCRMAHEGTLRTARGRLGVREARRSLQPVFKGPRFASRNSGIASSWTTTEKPMTAGIECAYNSPVTTLPTSQPPPYPA